MSDSIKFRLVDTSLYRTVVFVYNSIWLKKQCTIPTGLATNKIENKDAYATIEYSKNSFIFNDKIYKLFFLI